LKEKESTPDLLSLKRPSLFALLSVLDTIDSSINKRSSFDKIARCNPKLRNRSSTSKYLKLLQSLGLVKVEMVKQLPKNPRRIIKGGRTLKLYALTESGKSLLSILQAVESSTS
jgi:DNA-binding HxlR family transcriptional regulator